MIEEWKPIIIKGIDYTGLYEVSNFGRVRSLRGNHGESRIKVLKTTGTSYLRVALYKEGNCIKHLVHRLVATMFIPNFDMLPEVNHKDENPLNNNVNNLEWCSHKDNINYGTHNSKLSNSRKGIKFSEEHRKHLSESRLNNYLSRQRTVLQYDKKTLQLVREWKSPFEAQYYGVYNAYRIYECCIGKQKSHKNSVWKYKEDILNDY